MKARLTPRALSEAKRIKRWWHKNRPKAPDLFEEELAATIAMLRATPTLGTAYEASFKAPVRRVIMRRTHHELYYAVHQGMIVVLSVWGGPKKDRPNL